MDIRSGVYGRKCAGGRKGGMGGRGWRKCIDVKEKSLGRIDKYKEGGRDGGGGEGRM